MATLAAVKKNPLMVVNLAMGAAKRHTGGARSTANTAPTANRRSMATAMASAVARRNLTLARHTARMSPRVAVGMTMNTTRHVARGTADRVARSTAKSSADAVRDMQAASAAARGMASPREESMRSLAEKNTVADTADEMVSPAGTTVERPAGMETKASVRGRSRRTSVDAKDTRRPMPPPVVMAVGSTAERVDRVAMTENTVAATTVARRRRLKTRTAWRVSRSEMGRSGATTAATVATTTTMTNTEAYCRRS